MNTIEVRNSAWKMWLWAMAGVPMLVIGVDLLNRQRIFSFLQGLIWPNGNPELPEPRDYIWAVTLIVLGLAAAGYGLKELINPRPLVSGDQAGLHLRIRSPLHRAVTIPWDAVVDLGADEVDDDGEPVPVFWLQTERPELLPAHPWGARWLDSSTLAILAADWEQPPAKVAAALADIAVASAGETIAGVGALSETGIR